MRFLVLGPLAVIDGERALALGGPKQRATLAMLLLQANRPVSRDRLIDGIWGERPPSHPGRTLDTYISRLRALLDDDRIDRRSGGYALRVEPGELDLEQFDRAFAAGRYADALALWRGPALADLVFEPFARDAVPQLEERRLRTLEERIEAELDAGGGADLVGELEQLVREHPLRERFVGQLMLALYRAGRHPAALEAYRSARRSLASELGLEPGPHLQELERRMLAHDPGLDPGLGARSTGRAFTSRRRRGAAIVGVVLAAGALAGVVVATHASGAHRVARSASSIVSVDGASGRIDADSRLVDPPASLAAGFGSLWAADPNGGQVLRLDPLTGSVMDRIGIGAQPTAVAVGGGAVWAASAVGGFVTRIDPATDTRTETQRLGGANPSALAFARGSLWVADLTDRNLVEIDPRTGSVTSSVTLDLAPTSIAAAGRNLWAAGYDASAVDEVDTVAHRVVARLPVGDGPAALLAAAGSLWVANSLDGTLTRIDAVTGQTLSTLPIGNGPAALTQAKGSIWVADEYAGAVVRVDARTGATRGTVRTGGEPAALATEGGRVWVGAGPAAGVHRGGVLALSGISRPNSLDPAFNFTGSFEPTQLTRLLYDTLVTFDNAPGAAGLRLVPDLALQIPQPGDGGLQYVFHLRPGIRYSTGETVEAGDFRRAFERLFRTRSPGTGFFSAIVGARACVRRPTRCTLSRGVVTDDAAATVMFRLSRPDPDFVYELTEFAFSAPVPSGTPDRDLGWRQAPGTGPYRVAAAGTDGIRLARNPFFHEWSHAAQPAGNPDTITWRFPASHGAEIRDITRGKADWTFDFIPVPQLHAIEETHPELLHVNPAFIVEFIPLNTNLPPFDSVEVRKAVNVAVDRRAIARMYGGPRVATPLCQPLPPGMPGYARYCPYHGPDLVLARKLVAESGRKGSLVVVRGVPDEVAIPPGEPAYIARVLRSIGLRAVVRNARFHAITDADRRSFQLSVDGDWLPDFPTPASLLPPFFGCHGAHNNRYYCNAGLDRLMEQATLDDARDPARAARLWATADRTITDDAYWVPTVNLREVDLVSRRLHNYEYNAVWGFLADQAWTSG